MFLPRAAFLSTHILRATRRHFSGLNHYGHSLKRVPAIKTPIQTPIRLNFSRVEQAFEEMPFTSSNGQPGVLLKPLFFMIATSGVAMVGAAIWEYEYLRAQVKRMMASTSQRFPAPPKEREDSDLINFCKKLRVGEFKEAWSQLSPGDQLFMTMLVPNLLVFALWRLPSLRPRLIRSFTADPHGEAPCRSMLLSIFSHRSFAHIFASMFALYNFTDGISYALGKEQMVFLYVTAGMFANYVCYMRTVVRGISAPPCGATGAILGLLGYAWSKHPDIAFDIEFLDYVVAAGDVLWGILAFSLLGIMFKAKTVNHTAHLSGALFGICWHYLGEDLVWEQRRVIIEKVHALCRWMGRK